MAYISANLIVNGNVSAFERKRLANRFLMMYGRYTDICNNGLISLLNDEWHIMFPNDEPADSDEIMLAYNRFMSSHFQLVADTVNDILFPEFEMKLVVDPDTATCKGEYRGVEIAIDWSSVKIA